MLPLPNAIGEKTITSPSMLEIYFDHGSCFHWLYTVYISILII